MKYSKTKHLIDSEEIPIPYIEIVQTNSTFNIIFFHANAEDILRAEGFAMDLSIHFNVDYM